MNVVLSTRNPSKAEQIKAVFAGSPISILTLDEARIEGQGIEDGVTLEENALAKAMFVHQQDLNIWAMADDTGIFIDALEGRPGVYTADWNGGNKDTDQMTAWILRQLEGVQNRLAIFRTTVAIVSPMGKHYFFTGEVQGRILSSARAATQFKMPYAPIFMPDGTDKVWAEMTIEEENKISHRGKAFQKAREFLEAQI